jgi:uncharacterized membrane protein
MTTVVESIEVNVPVWIAYQQWSQFEEFPLFMKDVTQVTKLDATRLHWRAEIAGKGQEWVAKILEQTPDKRIAWTSRGGALSGASEVIVTLHPLSESKSTILFRIGYATDGIIKSGDRLSLQVQEDLKRFKAFIEKRGCLLEMGQRRINPSDFYSIAA